MNNIDVNEEKKRYILTQMNHV